MPWMPQLKSIKIGANFECIFKRSINQCFQLVISCMSTIFCGLVCFPFDIITMIDENI